jgi:hypothetical protein
LPYCLILPQNDRLNETNPLFSDQNNHRICWSFGNNHSSISWICVSSFDVNIELEIDGKAMFRSVSALLTARLMTSSAEFLLKWWMILTIRYELCNKRAFITSLWFSNVFCWWGLKYRSKIFNRNESEAIFQCDDYVWCQNSCFWLGMTVNFWKMSGWVQLRWLVSKQLLLVWRDEKFLINSCFSISAMFGLETAAFDLEWRGIFDKWMPHHY